MIDLQIRLAEERDINIIYRLGRQVDEFFVTEKTGGFWSKRQLRNWVLSKDDVCLVALFKKKIVGFLLSAYHRPTKKVVIENVFVIPRLRSKNIGTSILKQLINHVVTRHNRSKAVYFMALTRKNNKSFINLMQQLGFVVGYKDWVWIEKEFTGEFPKKP